MGADRSRARQVSAKRRPPSEPPPLAADEREAAKAAICFYGVDILPKLRAMDRRRRRKLLAVLLPGLPPDVRAQIGRELAREAGNTYAARGCRRLAGF
jgi:hypothetical protein